MDNGKTDILDAEELQTIFQPLSGQVGEPVIVQNVPEPLPLAIQYVVDSYVTSAPVKIIASRNMVNTAWGVAPIEECGYSILGSFDILSLRVSCRYYV